LNDITYPGEALTNRIAGSVKLTGRIDWNGTTTAIGLAERTTAGQQDLFVHEAIANLKTWRFEEASSQDPFQITYSYVIDESLRRGQVGAELSLPDSVRITGNPPQ
jgi:hypothetical protein